ncbi:hypothetical protein BS47DRAFT_991317 [Hydnum rufescens UP504]|uniref:Inositol phosphatase domain-containing protein n=1 Tax=Hydnum rufescens UP504 TaxID=1448309 RepID=A0A9P6DVX3_9AGAM|nr:hypothetical protein BS47DRAFT_991317 [Hydnum rufescens UP504]
MRCFRAAFLGLVELRLFAGKVKIFTRIPLGNIVRIEKGAYILSPLQEAGREREQNYGFLVAYRQSDKVETRMTSYTVGNVISGEDPLSSHGAMESSPSQSPSGSPLLTPSAALLPGSSPSSSPQQTERRRNSRRSRQLGSRVGPAPTRNCSQRSNHCQWTTPRKVLNPTWGISLGVWETREDV